MCRVCVEECLQRYGLDRFDEVQAILHEAAELGDGAVATELKELVHDQLRIATNASQNASTLERGGHSEAQKGTAAPRTCT